MTVKSLNQLGMNNSVPKRKPKGEVVHSERNAKVSKEYHARIQNSGVKRLNPTTVVPPPRSYPGLANG